MLPLRGPHAARLLLLTLAALLVAIAAWAADPTFPPLTGRVVDDAGILSPGTRARLDEMLAEHERQSDDQIVVVTLNSLQGYPIEDFGYRLGRFWGIGQKGRDNGALLIVAPHERKVRIEVGYGLEDRLTDAQTRIIIEQAITPAFRRGDYNTGVLDGTTAMLSVLGGTPVENAAPARPVQRGAPPELVILILIVIVWLVFSRFFWPLMLAGAGPRLYGGPGFYRGAGGGFGGGGFSGGGGSFGGGGASGSW